MADSLNTKLTPLATTWRQLMQVAGDSAPGLAGAIGKMAIAAVLHGLCLAGLLPLLVALVRDGDIRRAAFWLAIMAGLFALSAAVRWSAYNFEFHGGTIRITRRLRTELGRKLRRIALETVTQENSGAVAHKLLTGVDSTMTAIMTTANLIFLAVLPPMVVGVTLLWFDWRLSLLTLATFPLVAFFYYRRRPSAARSARANDTAHQQLHEQVLEYIQGLPLLRASGARLSEHRVAADIEQLEALQSADVKLSTNATLVMTGAIQMGLLVSLAMGGALVATGSSEIAVYLAFLLILARFGEPLTSLVLYTYLFDMLEQAVANVESLRAIPDQVALTPEAEPDGFDVRFEDVHFGYQGRETPALQGLSAHFSERSLSAIVGPSGQGKTTVFRLLQRFADPQAGRILIGGVDIRSIPPARLAALVSVVFQDVHVFANSVLHNIRMARPEATEDEVMAAARLAGCDDFIRAMPEGYATRIGAEGVALSGGERQRISIARAFLKDSPIILLDEPTAALDTANERLVQKALAELVKGRTVIVISHRLSLITGADRIFVIESGQVSEEGTHEELMSMTGRYSRMQSAQAEDIS